MAGELDELRRIRDRLGWITYWLMLIWIQLAILGAFTLPKLAESFSSK